MAITDPLALPDDVVIVPFDDLPPSLRERVQYEDGDYAITRPRSRTPSRLIDAQAAELLEEFRTPKTIVEAVISYSQVRKVQPEKLLDDAFPMIQHFINSRLLVPADSKGANQIIPSFEIGEQLAGFEMLRCVYVLEDTELYQGKSSSGEQAALKITRPGRRREMQRTFEREAAILRHLDGSVNPSLLEVGTFEGNLYLAIEWCSGVHASVISRELRHYPGTDGRKKLLRLCCAVLEAYYRLHAQGVIHSDVHPRNVLVAGNDSVKIIDYGFARLEDAASEYSKAHRGGIGFFFEPEYAKARLAGRKPPQASMLGEQYSLAAMLYFLLTGAHYLDFALEKDQMLHQIAEDTPLSFSSRGVQPWPDVEGVLAKALSKNPQDRFSSVSEFAMRLSNVAVPEEKKGPTIGRNLASEEHASKFDELLNNVLERVGPSGPLLPTGLTKAPTCSVNNGAAGIAYALYRIACIRDDAALLSLADIWSMKAMHDIASDTAFYSTEFDLTPEVVGPISLYHTASGVHCVRALINHAMGDMVSQQEAIEAFISASKSPCENLDLTLGRSGTLLACSLLLDTMPDHDLLHRKVLLEFGEQIMRGIWGEIDTFASIQECPELTFLGIAHGWAGVLYATMRWCRSSSSALPDAVLGRIQQLTECAEPIGRGSRWKRKIRRRGRVRTHDYVPSWCNGSAGFIHLWTLANQTFHDEAYLKLAEKAAWNTWEDPDSTGNLCCGFAGRAYGLLNLYKHTGEIEWLHRSQELAYRAAVATGTSAQGGDSLYKEQVGVAVLAADLSKPQASCMPLFEHEGWPALEFESSTAPSP